MYKFYINISNIVVIETTREELNRVRLQLEKLERDFTVSKSEIDESAGIMYSMITLNVYE